MTSRPSTTLSERLRALVDATERSRCRLGVAQGCLTAIGELVCQHPQEFILAMEAVERLAERPALPPEWRATPVERAVLHALLTGNVVMTAHVQAIANQHGVKRLPRAIISTMRNKFRRFGVVIATAGNQGYHLAVETKLKIREACRAAAA